MKHPENENPPQIWWPDDRETIPPEVLDTWPDVDGIEGMIKFHADRGEAMDEAQAIEAINEIRKSRYKQYSEKRSFPD